MALPALGMDQLHQARCGVRAGFFILLLVLVVLPVLVPESVYAFRIRDVSTASSEEPRSTCNPLLGRCTDQKISGVSSTVRLRRRFEGPGPVQARTNKIQPLVEESDEVDVDKDGPESGVSYAKSKSEKLAGLKISDNVRIQFRTTAAKTSTGNSGRGNVRLKASLASSDEEDEGGETEENYEDEEEEVDEEDDEYEDNDDEEESELDVDEDDVSDSRDSELGEAEINDTDEEEDKDELPQPDDEEDDDEDTKSTESVEESSESIKLEVKIIKPDVFGDKKNVKVEPARDARSVERDTKRSIEHVHEVARHKIVKDGKGAVRAEVATAKNDHVASGKVAEDNLEVDEEEAVDAESEAESASEQTSTLNESDDEPDDDDEDNEEKEDGSDTVDEVTPPPRKLEKVRLADKSKSMEMFRARSLEVLSEKMEPPMEKKPASEAKKLEAPKPTPPVAEMPEVTERPKPAEKISTSTTPQDTKKPEIKEKKKVTPPPKKETKSPSKQSEKPKVKVSEVKPDQKLEKPKSKPKKRTEASITLPELNDLLLHVPSFTPNFTAIKDPLCQQHGKIFLRQLRGYKLWALQMFDSSAKIPAGLLRGNVNQLGDFDQCLSVRANVKVDEKTVKVQGKYCLATVDFQATRQDMKIPVNLMQSRAFLRANMHEPTHFVPRFTTANWALCVPAVCSAEDVQAVMDDALSAYNVSLGLRFTIGVDAEDCYVKQKAQPYSKETVAVLYFYAMTVCLVFVATLRDFCVTSEGPGSYSERIIMAFSLRRTTRTLLSDSQSSGEIRCIHGVRSLATIFLYMAHKLIPMARVPLANRVSLTEVANNPLSSVLRVSLIYTDSFLFLSGVLTAYNMAREFNGRGEIRWFCRFVTRFIRLTPALLAVVFWYAFVMEHVGSGPQWSSVVKSNAELCKQNAWTNLLYIQNFFPFEEMCATHTHQLALDMQLSLIAPMLVFFLYSKPIVGILVILFLLQVSATVRYLATMNNYLSVVIFHGMTLKHLYKTANLSYALPLHRATPYLFGIGLGVLVRYTGKQIRMHKVLVIGGWLLAAALGLWSLFSPWKLARRDYTYDVEEATYYAVVLPVCWAAFLSWIIFASFTEHGGVVNKFLSSYWLVVFSRLSYSIYLTQFAVFFYNVGTTRYTSEFHVHRSIDLYEAATVIVVSITLTLLLDLPMQEVKNVIMESTDGLTLDEISNEEKNDEVTMEAENEMTEGPPDKEKLFLDEEVEFSRWNWQNDAASGREVKAGYGLDTEGPSEVWTYRKDEGKKRSFVVRDGDDEEIPAWDWIKAPVRKAPRPGREEDRDLRTERRSQSRQEILRDGYEDESKNLKTSSVQQARDEDGFRRERRSQSRASESKRTSAKDPEELAWETTRRDDSSLRLGDSKRSTVKDFDVVPREFSRRERSLAKENDNVAASTRRSDEQPPWEYVRRERSASQSSKDVKKSSFEGLDVQPSALRLSTRSLPRASELRKRVSSESEEEANRKEKQIPAKTTPSEEPRVSDEESWEEELRLRRQKIASSKPSEETGTASEEEDWSILKRRSSAEGKMALLNDSPDIEHFGAWSISKVPNPGSFLPEHSESEEENAYVATRNNYRETRAPFREGYDTQSEEETSWDPSRQQSYTSEGWPTSADEKEGPATYDFVLKRASKRTSLQNLSKISQEEPEAEEESGWDFVKEENTDSGSPQSASTGLFKRASIVKSQPSEEDPEYLLPERPKLVEQEQEHPFKKAWQMQKSRSEEDGPAGFLVKEKDGKLRTVANEGRKDASQRDEGGKRTSSSGGQNEDLSYFGGDEAESTSVSYPASNSDESANLDWIEEDERSGISGLEETEMDSTESAEKESIDKKEQKRHSEESNWEWNQEET